VLFTSFDFLVFFSVVFVVQRLLPHAPRNLFLLVSSCLFYASWDWRFLALVWLTVLTDYTVTHLLARSEAPSRRRVLLALSLGTNLGVLAFFKFAGFFAESARAALAAVGVAVPEWQLNVLLPVGISFYTFQSMSYTIDVYRRQLKPLASLVDFALYVTLFPQLVAGPIERGTHLARQVLRKRLPSREDIHHGSWLILKGLFKKAVLADNLAPIVDGVFATASSRRRRPRAAKCCWASMRSRFKSTATFQGIRTLRAGSDAGWGTI
jgi:alginate O-acetyltransferase complex protein AlgI